MSTTENDPLLARQDAANPCMVSLSNSSVLSTSPSLSSRGFFKGENYRRLDDSSDSFCQRRGVPMIFLFTLLALLFVVLIIFNSQFAALFETDPSHNALFQQYEQDWDTLEQVDDKYIPRGWEYDEACDSSHTFDLTFAVKLQNTDKLTDELMKTSVPESDSYGQHWTYEQVSEFFAPLDESVDEVTSWLEYHGIATDEIEYLTDAKDFIRVNVNCELANKMLNTEFGFWRNSDTNTMQKYAKSNSDSLGHLRVKSSYQVPSVVKDHLDFISPTLRFPMKHHSGKMEFISSVEDADLDELSLKTITSLDVEASYVTPTKLTELYHLEDYQSPSASTNQQAIASFLEEWFTYKDYYLFQTFFDVTRTKLTKNPDSEPEGYGSEAELDVQYITSTGRGIETVAYDVEDDLYFITLAQRIADSHNPPFVCSISYGGGEQSNGWGYCNRASIELGKVSLLGVTFFVSSGDDGAAGDTTCDDYDAYQPSFPASSPYVTAVGGTMGGIVQESCDTSTQEVAWGLSGGGFSVFFDRMSWQDSAVEDYFASGVDMPTSSLYNSGGRAYPDISALSVYYIICVEQSLWSVSGTSCSSPAVAGMFSQINDIRLQTGMNSLGWLNPRLYALFDKGQETYFNDVISGYSYGCSVDDYVGFYTAKGWDPVTGVGTPKMSTMAPPLIVM